MDENFIPTNFLLTRFHSFTVIAATFYEHYDEILNFYNNRASNAMAESFNAKIKLFKANLRGVGGSNPSAPTKRSAIIADDCGLFFYGHPDKIALHNNYGSADFPGQ